MREKVGNTLFFQWFGAPEGRKVGSLKPRVRSQLARWEMKNCRPSWREANFKVKMYKTHQLRTTFGSWDVEKVHAVVAPSTFPSQNVQNTPLSDHFWKLRCRKSARRCGAKHMSKSKCTKHTTFGSLLDVEMSKKRMRLWREAHVEVKSAQNWGVRSTFGRSDLVLHGRRRGLCTLSKLSKTWGFCSNFNYNHHYTPIHYTTATTTPSLHSNTLHSTTLHCTQLHSITLHYITLHSTTLHYTTFHTLHYITLRYTPQHYNYNYTTTLHYTKLHYTTLHYATLHYITLHYTTFHYTPLHYTTLHYTTLPSTTLHYIALHSTQLQLRLHNYTPLH